MAASDTNSSSNESDISIGSIHTREYIYDIVWMYVTTESETWYNEGDYIIFEKIEPSVRSSTAAARESTEIPATYLAKLKWRSWWAEHSCTPIAPGHGDDNNAFNGYTDFEFESVNSYMRQEHVQEDAVEYTFIQDERDERGFPFLKLSIDTGYEGCSPTCVLAWAKPRDETTGHAARLRGER